MITSGPQNAHIFIRRGTVRANVARTSALTVIDAQVRTRTHAHTDTHQHTPTHTHTHCKVKASAHRKPLCERQLAATLPSDVTVATYAAHPYLNSHTSHASKTHLDPPPHLCVVGFFFNTHTQSAAGSTQIPSTSFISFCFTVPTHRSVPACASADFLAVCVVCAWRAGFIPVIDRVCARAACQPESDVSALSRKCSRLQFVSFYCRLLCGCVHEQSPRYLPSHVCVDLTSS